MARSPYIDSMDTSVVYAADGWPEGVDARLKSWFCKAVREFFRKNNGRPAKIYMIHDWIMSFDVAPRMVVKDYSYACVRRALLAEDCAQYWMPKAQGDV